MPHPSSTPALPLPTAPATAADRPVVIVGGGPVGLTLAALLSHLGVGSTVIEADGGYCTGSRAICISRRSLEILGWTGADRRVGEIGLSWVGGRSYWRDTEVLHFRMPSEPGERFPPMINIQQYEIEEAAHRAIVPGFADVRWSTRVTGVRQTADGATVDVVDAEGGKSTVDAAWVVACDGGRSTVRDALGLQLRGIQYDGRYVIVDIRQETRRDVERLAWFDPPSNPGSTILMHRQPGDVWRIDYQIRDDEDPVEAVKPENVLPRVQSHLTMIGETEPWSPLWISIYNAKCLTLDDYRHGRVLFAGDAAHLVPIFGVRGLNSGLDDAGNLAWKLAAVVRGEATAALLDSYTDERLHAARENIAYGAKSTEFMAPPHFGFRLMREATLRLATESDAIRSLINPRQSTPVQYPAPAPIADDAGEQAGLDDDPLVGRPAPDARVVVRDVGAHPELADRDRGGGGERHLSEWFGRSFTALVFADAGFPGGLPDPWQGDGWADSGVVPLVIVGGSDDDAAAAQSSEDRVADGTTTLTDSAGEAWARYGGHHGRTVLVRPDGYVAACWSAPHPDVVADAFRRILRPAAPTGPGSSPASCGASVGASSLPDTIAEARDGRG